MRNLFRNTISHPALALGSTLLWGLVEFMALQNSRRAARSKRGR
ncbi:hypothetical protein [Propionivibrio sp.]